jgi:hypothetical protein
MVVPQMTGQKIVKRLLNVVPKDSKFDRVAERREFHGKRFGKYVVTIGNFPGGSMEQDDPMFYKIPVRVWESRLHPEAGFYPVEADEILTIHEYLDPGPGDCFYNYTGKKCKNTNECYIPQPRELTAYLNERDLIRVKIGNQVMKIEERLNPEYWKSKEEILEEYCTEIWGEPLKWWSLADAAFEVYYNLWQYLNKAFTNITKTS